ncbi:MAG: glycosyltransferase family 4 protein [FCB group bacterium]|jgi:glycosyltransferase involved in cell wall biosynthesis|nr:glycosyltransferase family 4 protein [FCB group bacterium]
MSAHSTQTVLLVSHTSFPGGAERSLFELAQSLHAGRAYRPVLVCPAEGALPRWAAARGISVMTYAPPRVEGRGPAGLAGEGLCAAEAVWTLRRHIAHAGAHLVHANGLKAFAVGVAAARWAGIPCVFHSRDYPHRPVLLRNLIGRADATVTASRFMAQALRQTLGMPALDVAVVANPVASVARDVDAGRRMRAKWGIGAHARVVAMIAQMVPWKRHDLFLEAAALLRSARRDLHFVIAGSDPWGVEAAYTATLTARASRPDLAGGVTFAGQFEDVGALLSASDALVLPSEGEPFGRVVVEAWWAGVPVVVSNHGGPAELVDHGRTGLHFSRGNAAALAVAVQRVLSDSALRDSITARGRQEAARFAPEAHAEAVVALYRGLLE